IARVYADAFLNALPADQVGQALEEFRSFIDEVLDKNPDFERLLTSDTVSRDQKVALIDRVVAGRGSELFTNFLRVLARRDRLNVLPIILAQCDIEYEKRSGRKRVQVVTAQPLSDAMLAKIRDRLASTMSFEPVIEPAVDPDLLGGLRLRIGDTVFDGS